MTRPAPSLSSAALSGVLVEIPCRRAVLAAWLAAQGPLELVRNGRSRSAHHPVYCELWSVRDGGLCVGAATQHDIWELGGRAGGVALHAMAQAWAPRTGPVRDMLLGNARAGADLLPGLFRRFSEALVAPLSTYFEIMIWIPAVQLRGSAEAFSFVVGMFTDSAVARWADVALGFGYRKQPGRFHVPSAHAFRVNGTNGAQLLAFSGKRSNMPIDDAAVDTVERALELPLLGLTRSGHLARSTLKRSLASAQSLERLSGQLQLAPGVIPDASGRASSAPARARRSCSALRFSNMRAVVSYPARVR